MSYGLLVGSEDKAKSMEAMTYRVGDGYMGHSRDPFLQSLLTTSKLSILPQLIVEAQSLTPHGKLHQHEHEHLQELQV